MWRVLLLRVGRVLGLGTRGGAGRGGGGGEVCLAGGFGKVWRRDFFVSVGEKGRQWLRPISVLRSGC